MMVWKSERQRSVTFRRRVPRLTLGGLDLQAGRASPSRVLACTALIVPARNDCELGPTPDWVVLVTDEIISRARQRMLDKARAAQDKSDNGPKQ
ncbi:hypothetical protein ATY81_08735 [Rhizobium sp. R72]|nr:hypothetical protein ATY81_08735 [Rhizobium sp. R72]OWV97836.1 hypothetical protein ATY80_08735 [Rhizobium sp. R711]